MPADIYGLHESAFARVSAYVLTDSSGELVARIALKYPADGAGRLYCYFHLMGSPMVRGFASGYGYHKRSAAISAALRAMRPEKPGEESWQQTPAYRDQERATAERVEHFRAMGDDKRMDSGQWVAVFESAGFRILQAV